MDYIKRALQRKFCHMSDFFKVILVTGARQVGKTTMLRHLAGESGRTFVSLDDLMARNLAKTDPVLFFQTYKPPIIIDEIQYAPELFSQIKILCEDSEETGRFWVTGSQQYKIMKNVHESLAGRIAILELYSLTKNEKEGIFYKDELDFSLADLQLRQAQSSKNDITEVFNHIWRGGMPLAVSADAERRQEYYSSYISSYLMRDVTEQGGVTDTLRFGKLLTACAAFISRQLNYKTLSDAAGISQPTAKEWLRLLEGMGIIFLLQPYASNELKRLTKTPKLYFCDTGLAAHLSMWPTVETLQNGAASGHYFENHIVGELLKNYSYSEARASLFYYRDSNAQEIDLLIQRGNNIHPFQIKQSALPDRREIKKFSILNKAITELGNGGIICMCEEVVPIDKNNFFIPCNLI
jgi:predicted AAA+ superfamily ATPase